MIKQTWALVGLMGLIFPLWTHPVLYPLKLLVVFFHESSHALAVLASGGRVDELVIVKEQGGHVLSRGGNRFVILSAGYLGSLFWGVVLYCLAVQSRLDRVVMSVLGLFMIVTTVLYAKGLFSWAFGLGAGIAILGAACFLSREINDFLLRMIALTSMLYVPLDIYSDTIQRPALHSDAAMLADEFGGTAMFWGLVWLALSIVVIVVCLGWSHKRGAPVSRSAFRAEKRKNSLL